MTVLPPPPFALALDAGRTLRTPGRSTPGDDTGIHHHLLNLPTLPRKLLSLVMLLCVATLLGCPKPPDPDPPSGPGYHLSVEYTGHPQDIEGGADTWWSETEWGHTGTASFAWEARSSPETEVTNTCSGNYTGLAWSNYQWSTMWLAPPLREQHRGRRVKYTWIGPPETIPTTVEYTVDAFAVGAVTANGEAHHNWDPPCGLALGISEVNGDAKWSVTSLTSGLYEAREVVNVGGKVTITTWGTLTGQSQAFPPGGLVPLDGETTGTSFNQSGNWMYSINEKHSIDYGEPIQVIEVSGRVDCRQFVSAVARGCAVSALSRVDVNINTSAIGMAQLYGLKYEMPTELVKLR